MPSLFYQQAWGLSYIYIYYFLVRFTIKACFLNTHKNTSWPNNSSKCSICLSIYPKTHSHGEKSNRKILFTTFLKEKRRSETYQIKDS
ncbi:UNVERIFIED_CONTAM: hypothetical protein NCL1_62190 [Trichonephila clavipes]